MKIAQMNIGQHLGLYISANVLLSTVRHRKIRNVDYFKDQK